MNSVQGTKVWQMDQPTTTDSTATSSPPPPSMQSPPLSRDSPATTTSQTNNDNNNTYPPTPAMHHHQQPYLYTQNTMMHPPLHPYPQQEQRPTTSTPNYMATVKEESDPRLPGLMVLSQPGTPRPNSVISSDNGSPNAKKSRHSYVSAFPSMPYPEMPRKRSRNDGSFFSNETGPSFSAAKPLDNLYSPDRTNLLTVRVQSKMDRGFFLADNDWTCYRRNYFQVSSTFSIHGINPYFGEHELQCYVQTAHQGLQPVARFVLGISARVSSSDKTVDLIQHTPKRDKGPQMIPEPKTIAPGGNLSLSSVGNTQNIATFERIQFKTATANNGKRRAAQQYYVVVVDLMAETHHGERVSVASCISSPLVVRGRSPGHYADSQDRSSATTSTNASMMAAAAAAAAVSAGSGDDPYGHYHKPPMTPPAPAMMGGNGGGSGGYGMPYGYYNAYPHGAFPSQPMMMPNPPTMPLPTPTTSSPHSAISGSSSSSTTSSSNGGSGTPSTSPHGHPPYMVHSMSDPSSSESSSPDLYQGATVDYSLHQGGDKPHHPSQLHIHSLPMDPSGGGAAHGQWSRSRYHSAGSVSSPSVEHHPPYFSQPQQHHTNGPPTPTTPFSTRKYDTTPTAEQQQQNS